jgi:hypothetical protein
MFKNAIIKYKLNRLINKLMQANLPVYVFKWFWTNCA